jgi:hypothetical protein
MVLSQRFLHGGDIPWDFGVNADRAIAVFQRFVAVMEVFVPPDTHSRVFVESFRALT